MRGFKRPKVWITQGNMASLIQPAVIAIFVAALLTLFCSVTIRVGIRAYFREKRAHLRAILGTKDEKGE
jgi:hypothetical protein